MASRSTTLSEENVADLLEQYGSSLVIEDEWIRIPRRAFSSSGEDDIVAIPRYLNSLATLRFLGLSKDAANATWERYQSSSLYEVDDIINFAKATVRAGHDTDLVDDNDWIAAMRTMGASEDLRTRIMTPGHQDIRMMKTPMAWVLQTMKERYDVLCFPVSDADVRTLGGSSWNARTTMCLLGGRAKGCQRMSLLRQDKVTRRKDTNAKGLRLSRWMMRLATRSILRWKVLSKMEKVMTRSKVNGVHCTEVCTESPGR